MRPFSVHAISCSFLGFACVNHHGSRGALQVTAPMVRDTESDVAFTRATV
jgi:hypothetical protein